MSEPLKPCKVCPTPADCLRYGECSWDADDKIVRGRDMSDDEIHDTYLDDLREMERHPERYV